jgi:hypothetical protein
MALMMETQEWHWQINVTRGALAKLASKEPHLHLRVVIIAANVVNIDITTARPSFLSSQVCTF